MANSVRLAVRDEFKMSHLKLHLKHYECFSHSQLLPLWLLLLLRIVMGGVCLFVFGEIAIRNAFSSFSPPSSNSSSSDDNGSTIRPPSITKRHFFLCYLTIWSYLVIAIYFTVAVCNTLWLKCSRREEVMLTSGGYSSAEQLMHSQENLSADTIYGCGRVLLKLQWLLFGIAANASVVVTGGFWIVLYPLIAARNPGSLVPALDIFVHALNLGFMLVETICGGVEVRLVHFLFTAAYAIIYCVFSLFYWLPDHTNVIYPILLDWNNVGLTLAVGGGLLFIGLPLVQLLWWLVFKLRCWLGSVLVANDNWQPPSVKA